MTVPHHLGIIIDGNRRWAREKKLPTFEGHRRGFDKFKKVAKWCWERGIKVLTIYGFSTENWNRSKLEINYLMRLNKQAFSKKNVQDLHREKIKIRVIGQIERLSEPLREAIKQAENLTKNNEKGIFNICLSYGGRTEIVEAVKKLIKKKIPPANITEEIITKNLWMGDISDPDLIIRTGGAKRLSNFLTWQSVYSEFCFYEKYWPDFEKKDLDKILKEYSERERRFGK